MTRLNQNRWVAMVTGVVLIAAFALAIAAATGPLGSAHAAKAKKSHKIKITIKGTKLKEGTDAVSLLSGTFGKGKSVAHVLPPTSTAVWTLKGGKIYTKVTSDLKGTLAVSKSFKFVKGTGKFKGIKAIKVTQKVDILTGDGTVTGTAKY